MAIMTVPARLSLLTLGVSDVERATQFYAGFGWRLSSASVPGDVSFFDLAGAKLALWKVDELSKDARAQTPTPSPPSDDEDSLDFRGVAAAVNCDDRDQVDEMLKMALELGGSIPKPADVTEWGGYSGYFVDLDGHLWEVAHNPGWPIGSDGVPQLP
jgi:uncharacterized protein